MQIIKPGVSFDFVGRIRPAVTASTIVIVLALGLIFIKGFNYGIDFAGGVEMRLEFQQDVSIDRVREAIAEIGIKGVQVVTFLMEGRNVFSIKAKGESSVEEALKSQAGEGAESEGSELPDVAKVILDQMKSSFGEDKVSIMSTDMVGPRVGKGLRRKGLFAILFSMVGILIYIGFRFNFRYSPGCVAAMAHDVILVSGLFVLMNKEISLSIIAALLTIAGYSVNDTIVIYDRIREGHTTYRGKPIREIVNRSLNDTLSRTFLTSLTTLLVLGSVFFLGSEIIRDFSLAMILGVIVGTYSSLFIASPVYIALETASLERRRKARKR